MENTIFYVVLRSSTGPQCEFRTPFCGLCVGLDVSGGSTTDDMVHVFDEKGRIKLLSFAVLLDACRSFRLLFIVYTSFSLRNDFIILCRFNVEILNGDNEQVIGAKPSIKSCHYPFNINSFLNSPEPSGDL